jgi:hypothetical protein
MVGESSIYRTADLEHVKNPFDGIADWIQAEQLDI